jgi:polyisoprenoid-binding protein YceI
MKKSILSAGVIAIIALASFKGTLSPDVYKVDTSLSSLEWTGEKVTGKHNGTIMLSNGTITSEKGVLSGIFEVKMSSIVNKDVEDVQWKTKLENHLKGPDFFDTEKFPAAKFVTTSITPIKDAKEGDFTHKVKGNLTIKDKTNEISFDAVIKTEGNKIACVGTATIDRSKFDVKYGSKSFFPEIGDKMIYDEFQVKFNIVAVK